MALILIVEDDLDMSDLIALTLRMEAHEVVQAYDAVPGLKLADELGPDLILLDVMLPEMSGYEVARTLRERPSTVNTPIIFVTGNSNVEDVVQGLEVAVDYVHKPFDVAELQARVRAALRMRLLQEELRQTNERLERLAITDALTGVCNRRGFDSALQDELWRAHRFGHPLSVLMFDLDRFKSINDNWGHSQGDIVLQAFGRVLLESSRHVDKVGRYGGEEFAVVLPATDAAGAASYAEKVRVTTAALALPPASCAECSSDEGGVEPIRLTVSGGGVVALSMPQHGEDITSLTVQRLAERLLREADNCLYQAKESGRNRIVMKTIDNLTL